MSKVLVAGGAGFIGSHVVRKLLNDGYEVCVYDNLSSGSLENLEEVSSKINFFEGDIRNLEGLKNAVKGCEHVIHLAAMRAVLRSVDNPLETNEVNVTGLLNSLIAARDEGIKRFVFSSSSSVNGDNDNYPLDENAKHKPLSPYAATKVMGEHYCRVFYQLYGLETVSLRYFNVFGPRQNPASKYSAVIPIILACLIRNESPEIHWDGEQTRDFSFVDNVALANSLALSTENVAGEVFNIACHEEHSILDIFNGLKQILKKDDIEPIFKPKRAGDIRRSFADITKAEEVLGYQVQTRFKEGLQKTVEWFMQSDFVKSVS